MNIELRELEKSDFEYFSRWWRDKELIALTSGVDYLISDDEVREYLDDMINASDGWHFMIEADKKTIGHISLTKGDDNWYQTQIVIGNKDYFSKGYGSMAIKKLLEFAKDEGFEKIFLEVRPDNDRAINAYKKCGFVEKEIVSYPDNKFLPEALRMELALGQ